MYARHWEKDDRSGYSPAYEFNWDEFMAHKRRGGSMKDFENKKLIPLTKEVIKKHLLGQHIVGIYPILPENTSYFIAADFDAESWLADSILHPASDTILPEFMGWLTSTHTRQSRTRTKTIGYGHIYQDRYKSFPVESD